MDARELKDYAGQYEVAHGKTLTISEDAKHLSWQEGDKPKVELIPEAGPIVFRKGIEGRTLFRRAANGKVYALIERRNNEDVVWKKVAE
jgi:hypothetical protein